MFRPRNIATLCFLSALLITPALVRGADLSLSSTTSATRWEEDGGNGNSAVSEYAAFHSRGRFGGFRLEMEGYGRFTHLDEEVEPGDEDPHRLYVLAATLAGEEDRTVIILGRQFLPALVGPDMIDGLSVSTSAGKAAFNARWGYRSDVSSGSLDDTVLGLGFSYRIKPGMHLSLDYGRTYDDRTLSELLATEWVYSWHRFTKAYVNFNWDLMSSTLHESLVGARLFFSDRFSAVFEFAHNVQVFDSDSIYSVFAVDAAYTRSVSLLFTPTRNTRYAWDYIVESYQGGGGGRRYELSGNWTPGSTKVQSKLLQHTGYGGDLVEVSASVLTPVFHNFSVGTGGDFARSENPGEESVSSSAAFLSCQWDMGRNTSLGLRLERCDDELTEATQTGKLSLKVEF